MPRITLVTLLSALFIAIPFIACADGDARPATQAERDYCVTVQTAFDKALPPAPEGWTMGDRTKVEAWKHVSTGVGKDPLRVEFFMEARDEKKIEAAGLKANDVYEEMSKNYGSARNTAMVEEMQKKLDVLSKQMEAAITKNDSAAVERIMKEIEAAQAPAKDMGDSINKELKQKMAVVKARDAHLRAVLIVNSHDVALDEFAAEATVAGHPAYWRENPADHDGDFEGEWLAFAGAWTVADQDGTPAMTPAWDLGLPHTTAQNLMVRVSGDKARGRRLLEELKWDAVTDLFPKK